MKRSVAPMLIFLTISAMVTSGNAGFMKTYNFGGIDIGLSVDLVHGHFDSGYIISGSTASSVGGNTDLLVLRIDLDGNEIWHKIFNCPGLDDTAHCVRQVGRDPARFLVAGRGECDQDSAWFLLLGRDGEVIWDNRHHPIPGELAIALHGGATWVERSLSGDGYIACGYAETRALLMRLDNSGDMLWNAYFGGQYPLYTCARSVREVTGRLPTGLNGYIMVGAQRNINTTYTDLWICKTRLDGTLLKETILGDSLQNEEAYAIAPVADLNFVAVGHKSAGNLGWPDIWLLKLDGDYGDTVWTKTYGHPDYPEYAFDITETFDTGLVIAGYKEGNLWLIRTDNRGDTLWTRMYGGAGDDRGYAIIQDDDSGFVVVGYTSSYGSYRDLWVLKVDSLGNVPVERNFAPWQSAQARFHVTVSTGRSRRVHFTGSGEWAGRHCSVEVFSATGQSCARIALDPGSTAVWDARNYSAGVYAAVMKTRDKRQVLLFTLD